MKERKRRILVCKFQQETDTFNPMVMKYDRFLRNEYVESPTFAKTLGVELKGADSRVLEELLR